MKWDPAQERLGDFVCKLKGIGQELGKNADEQLEYFKCSVPPHLYLYLQGTTTIKEAMENIKRACALDRVSVQAAPVDTTTTQSVPFMQITERPDFRNVPRNDDHIELTALKFKGMIDSLNKFIDRLTKSVGRSVEKQSRKLDIEDPVQIVETIETVGRVEMVEEVIGVIQIQVQKMIDIGLEVEIVLEVGLEVEEEPSRPVLIAKNQNMSCLTVIN